MAFKTAAGNADRGGMSVWAISGSSFAAIAGGVQAQFKAIVLSSALKDAGLLDANLNQGLRALQAAGHSTTRAGLAALHAQTIGGLIDVLA